jgi:hypothetical protein
MPGCTCRMFCGGVAVGATAALPHAAVAADRSLRPIQRPLDFFGECQNVNPFVGIVRPRLAVKLPHIGRSSMMKGDQTPLIIKHRTPRASGLGWGPVVYDPLIPVE